MHLEGGFVQLTRTACGSPRVQCARESLPQKYSTPKKLVALSQTCQLHLNSARVGNRRQIKDNNGGAANPVLSCQHRQHRCNTPSTANTPNGHFRADCDEVNDFTFSFRFIFRLQLSLHRQSAPHLTCSYSYPPICTLFPAIQVSLGVVVACLRMIAFLHEPHAATSVLRPVTWRSG